MNKPNENPASSPMEMAWAALSLLDAVADGRVLAADATSSGDEQQPSMFTALRNVASGIIGKHATDQQRDALAIATLQRIRDLRDELLKSASDSDPDVAHTQKLAEPLLRYRKRLKLFRFAVRPDATPDELFSAANESALRFATQLNQRFIATLKQTGRTGARFAAQWLENDSPQSDPWRLWRARDQSCAALRLLAEALWFDEVKTELKRIAWRSSEPARLSSALSSALSIGRITGARIHDAEIVVEAPRDFALFLPLNEPIKLTSEGKQQQLVFKARDGGTDSIAVTQGKDEGLISLRQVLDGPALRDYLAMSLLWVEAGTPSDGIVYAEDDYILEMTGAATSLEKSKNGRKYERYTTKARKSLAQHLALFASLRVRGIGTLEARVGDLLCDELRDRRDGRKRWYAHSRLIVHHMQSSYIQVPRAVCKLDAQHVPLAIGLANVVRRSITSYLRDDSSIDTTLTDLAVSSGIDLSGIIRREGRPAAIKAIAESIVQVAADGQIGDVKLFGEGESMLLSIKPSEALRASYQRLVAINDAHDKARDKARIADQRKPKKLPK